MKKDVQLNTEKVTREGGIVVSPQEKTSPDIFLEEYGKDWPLEHVQYGWDDGGKVLEIFCEKSRSAELRKVVPHRFGEERVWTIVIGVHEGYGKEL